MKQLEIGQKVIVCALARPEYTGNKRNWVRKEIKEREGWYVGYSHKQEGILKYEDYEGYDVINYLEVTKVIKLARVKFQLNSNDSFAFENDIREI